MLHAHRALATAAIVAVLPIPLGQAHEAASRWAYP